MQSIFNKNGDPLNLYFQVILTDTCHAAKSTMIYEAASTGNDQATCSMEHHLHHDNMQSGCALLTGLTGSMVSTGPVASLAGSIMQGAAKQLETTTSPHQSSAC